MFLNSDTELGLFSAWHLPSQILENSKNIMGVFSGLVNWPGVRGGHWPVDLQQSWLLVLLLPLACLVDVGSYFMTL